MAVKTLGDLELAGRRALVRMDLNVPTNEGAVTDATRIERAAPTLQALLAAGARPIVLSHFGRPKGRPAPEFSLAPIAPALSKALGGVEVALAPYCVGPEAERAALAAPDGAVVLLENTRFHAGEEANDPDFAAELARLGDLFVNDAFSAAHRAHASTEGLARLLPSAAGPALQAELDALGRALGAPERPLVAVVGGAKVSSKIDLLKNLIAKVDCLVIGGGMANTFLAAGGAGVGASLCEHDLLHTAREISAAAAARG
ncbi:MAG: phosphoglycerate kinase, partial [Pseudomonadota bacterium]